MFLKKSRKLFLTVAMLLAFSILFCACSSSGGSSKKNDSKASSPETALKNFFNATVKGDGKAVCELTVDPYEAEYRYETGYYDYDDEEEMIEYFKEDAEDNKEYLEYEYGKNLKVDVKILETTNYDKDDIDILNEYIFDSHGYKYYDEDVLQDICVIEAEATIKGSEDEESDIGEFVLYKMKGKWYYNSIAGLYSKYDIEDAIEYYK